MISSGEESSCTSVFLHFMRKSNLKFVLQSLNFKFLAPYKEGDIKVVNKDVDSYAGKVVSLGC